MNTNARLFIVVWMTSLTALMWLPFLSPNTQHCSVVGLIVFCFTGMLIASNKRFYRDDCDRANCCDTTTTEESGCEQANPAPGRESLTGVRLSGRI